MNNVEIKYPNGSWSHHATFSSYKDAVECIKLAKYLLANEQKFSVRFRIISEI